MINKSAGVRNVFSSVHIEILQILQVLLIVLLTTQRCMK